MKRYKLTCVVIKVHRLLNQAPSAVGGHWIADLVLVSCRIQAPATPLPALSEATVKIIREHQAQERMEQAVYEFDVQLDKEEREKLRREETADAIMYDNEVAEEEKEAEEARQEALADAAMDDHEMAEEEKEAEHTRQEALADAAFDQQAAQVDSENTFNPNCLLFACMGSNAIWYVQITATHTHLFVCLYVHDSS